MNNYIRNSVRVGYEELVPLCRNGEDSNTTDKCVEIENIDAFTSSKEMHVPTARRDIIKHWQGYSIGIQHSVSGDRFFVIRNNIIDSVKVTLVKKFKIFLLKEASPALAEREDSMPCH